ncbi:cupin domain-containing protein [Nocardioides sp.]|uniref:cupin domain-containing protein n=1 Tax=Nocardioides sp. TaxID=35761 RepID=UPI003D0FA340
MSARLLSSDVVAAALQHEPLPVEDLIDGEPTAASTPLDSLGGVEIGIWEMTVGGARDTEVDEVFIVVSGRGTVRFDDGEELALSPGVAVRLSAGEQTSWTVHETLRKVYIAPE